MKFYLILISIFFTLFKVTDASLSITYGDFFSLIIVFFFINDLFRNRFKFQLFSKYWIYYLIILFISATVNLSLFEGRFLNILKTNIFSLIYFVIVYSLVLENKITASNFIKSISVLGFLFLLKTWPEMQKAWALSDREFTHIDIFESSLNLNTWGYTLLIFLIIALYAWVKSISGIAAIFSSLMLIIFIYFSFSRTAYALTGFILVWVLFYINKTNLKKLILPILIMTVIIFFGKSINVFNFQVSDSAKTFFEGKADSFEDDLIDTRFYLINIKPLIENFEIFNPIQMLFGDGISVQHSFISHTLIVTGILGFLVFTIRFLYVFKYSWLSIKKRIKVEESKFLILIILVVLINDFITNVSSYLPFVGYLSSIVIAFFFAEIDKNENETKFNISNRV